MTKIYQCHVLVSLVGLKIYGQQDYLLEGCFLNKILLMVRGYKPFYILISLTVFMASIDEIALKAITIYSKLPLPKMIKGRARREYLFMPDDFDKLVEATQLAMPLRYSSQKEDIQNFLFYDSLLFGKILLSYKSDSNRLFAWSWGPGSGNYFSFLEDFCLRRKHIFE